jgi:hemerythrin-like domain-containing protein
MTLRQTIQAAPAKTNELIGKLVNTSNNAVKTRESLFEQLTSELSLYVDVEEQHLVPLLRKHAETKALAADAAKANKDLRAQLSALGSMPKDNDEFLAEVDELKKTFQQHVRDERKELLPAVLKALSDEEASETAAKIEAAVAEAEEAKRAEKRAEAAEAKRKADKAQQAEEQERAAVRAAKSAQRASRDAAEKVAESLQQTATSVQDGARQVSQRLVETTTEVVSSARDAVAMYSAPSENVIADLRAITASSTAASKATQEVGSALTDWARNTAALNVNASRKVMQCKTFADLAQAQREFVEASMRTWMEGSSALLQITQQASKQALDPLQARLEKAA